MQAGLILLRCSAIWASMADVDTPRESRTEAKPRRHASALPLPDQVALVLQGGGALGSYQAGVIDGLADSAIEVDWVAGISIGAVNAAIFAGNPPERRVERLRQFWDRVTSSLPSFPIFPNDHLREWLHEWSAGFVLASGVPGFFSPRPVSPMFAAPGTPEALSFYDSRAADRDARRADRLGAAERWSGAPVGGRRRCGQRQLPLFRYDARTARCAAHHGFGRAAAGAAACRNRRPLVVGRRAGFEHPAQPCAGSPEPRVAGVSGRSVFRSDRAAANDHGRDGARKGNPLLQPHRAR